MNILVTGASGMIGSKLVSRLSNDGHSVLGVDRTGAAMSLPRYRHVVIDLADSNALEELLAEEMHQGNTIDRTIHLAALAHSHKGETITSEQYYRANVQASDNVFNASMSLDAPILYISTVDVYGFTKEVITPETIPHPVSEYAKSKYEAEKSLKRTSDRTGVAYSIFRFSPVYTNDIKRDIQKRYYLRYPRIAYRIGKGSEYEVLNVDKAVDEMACWCTTKPNNDIKVIKDEHRMWTPDCIATEKKAGRASVVLVFPRFLVRMGYDAALALMGENGKTYLISKAVHPYRSI